MSMFIRNFSDKYLKQDQASKKPPSAKRNEVSIDRLSHAEFDSTPLFKGKLIKAVHPEEPLYPGSNPGAASMIISKACKYAE